MIRYRQLTEAELAGIAERVEKPARKIKLSTAKKEHHDRQKEPAPRKIAGRHAVRNPKA